ncbi:LPS translocon maturation chaperone LptM [Martelella mediterranea]|uniref:Putative lipoprotein n=1 Tax=Martelella mediterranea TaxID=293089 RepID=A0A4R3NSU8_9HYPH|nr:lipoprotein [Martelella mediterranea]TCT39086.1 putative lipoprotein [Martelella mediterranea]
MRKITIATAALFMSALALSSCGRKGPLEVPPANPQTQAVAAEKQNATASQPDIQIAPNDKPVVFDGSGDMINTGPTASSDGNQFFLDRLLD